MATTTGVGWGKPQAHPNVAVHIDVPTLGFAVLTPTYAGSLLVIPAQAGIQWRKLRVFATKSIWLFATIERCRYWIPACAGMTVAGGAAVTAVVAGVGWGKPQAHPNVAVRIDVPTLGFAALTPTYAALSSSFLRRQEGRLG